MDLNIKEDSLKSINKWRGGGMGSDMASQGATSVSQLSCHFCAVSRVDSILGWPFFMIVTWPPTRSQPSGFLHLSHCSGEGRATLLTMVRRGESHPLMRSLQTTLYAPACELIIVERNDVIQIGLDQ